MVLNCLGYIDHQNYQTMKSATQPAMSIAATAGIKIKKMIASLGCMLVCQTLQAQEIFAPSNAAKVANFKFEQLIGGVILIQVRLNDFTDTLNFILDTGSGGISLDSGTVARHKLPSVATDRTIRGIAGVKQVNYSMHHTLHLPGLRIDSLDFHINDYELLTGVYGLQVDGIIGYSVLRRYIIEVDYDSLMLTFYTPGAYKYPRGGTLLHPAFSTLPIQTASVKENATVMQRFYLDTGGGLCILLSNDFVQDSSLFAKNKKMLNTISEGLGGKKPMKVTTLKEVKIGPYKFKRVPTYLFEDDYNVTSYPTLGGLIGADLLRRFNIILNYPKAEIHLLPNSHYRDAFDYAYTGMELYYTQGKVIIGDVIPNGPAAKAGLQEGDEIFSVDNVLSSNYQKIKNILQNAQRWVRIIALRQGGVIEAKLKVDTIN